jgi:ASC-1-like (ASCH) protein
MEETTRQRQSKPTNRRPKLTTQSNQQKLTNQTTRTNHTNKKRTNKIKPTYIEFITEPWFSLIQLGLKTVEGRKNKGKFKEMKVGDIIEWRNNNFKPRSFLTQITGKAEYPNFQTYLETEGLDKCLPNMEKYGIEHGLHVYYKFYTKEEEQQFGVVAIRLKVI